MLAECCIRHYPGILFHLPTLSLAVFSESRVLNTEVFPPHHFVLWRNLVCTTGCNWIRTGRALPPYDNHWITKAAKTLLTEALDRLGWALLLHTNAVTSLNNKTPLVTRLSFLLAILLAPLWPGPFMQSTQTQVPDRCTCSSEKLYILCSDWGCSYHFSAFVIHFPNIRVFSSSFLTLPVILVKNVHNWEAFYLRWSKKL